MTKLVARDPAWYRVVQALASEFGATVSAATGKNHLLVEHPSGWSLSLPSKGWKPYHTAVARQRIRRAAGGR